MKSCRIFCVMVSFSAVLFAAFLAVGFTFAQTGENPFKIREDNPFKIRGENPVTDNGKRDDKLNSAVETAAQAGGEAAAKALKGEKEYGRFYERPLSNGENIMIFYFYRGLPEMPWIGLDEINKGFFHEHFYTDSGEPVVGYGPEGIYEKEDDLAKERKRLSRLVHERFEVDIMRDAAECLRRSGRWLPNPEGKTIRTSGNPYHYDVMEHNCQHFAEELRQVYYMIKVIKQYLNACKIQENFDTAIFMYDATLAKQLDGARKSTENALSKCPRDFQNVFRKHISDVINYHSYSAAEWKKSRKECYWNIV